MILGSALSSFSGSKEPDKQSDELNLQGHAEDKARATLSPFRTHKPLIPRDANSPMGPCLGRFATISHAHVFLCLSLGVLDPPLHWLL